MFDRIANTFVGCWVCSAEGLHGAPLVWEPEAGCFRQCWLDLPGRHQRSAPQGCAASWLSSASLAELPGHRLGPGAALDTLLRDRDRVEVIDL